MGGDFLSEPDKTYEVGKRFKTNEDAYLYVIFPVEFGVAVAGAGNESEPERLVDSIAAAAHFVNTCVAVVGLRRTQPDRGSLPGDNYTRLLSN